MLQRRLCDLKILAKWAGTRSTDMRDFGTRGLLPGPYLEAIMILVYMAVLSAVSENNNDISLCVQLIYIKINHYAHTTSW